jgi:F-type H+-transporting ATPase subunit b
MIIDATFWVAISFFIFLFGLIYIKVPNKINNSLDAKIKEIVKELNEAKELKSEAKNLLSDYESKIDKSKKETKEIITTARNASEAAIIEKNKKFHQMMEDRKRNAEQKIILMKQNALDEIKNMSIKISMEAVKNIIKNSIDKKKLEKIYIDSFKETKKALKIIRV